jgi:anti-sigma B factor antagonist
VKEASRQEERQDMQNYGPRVAVNQNGEVTEVELLDEEILDENTINDVAETLFAVVEDKAPVKLLLSFGRVKHLSSSALGTLIRLNKRIDESKGALKLCSIRASLYEVFVITKLNKLFDIYKDEDTALKSFGR